MEQKIAFLKNDLINHLSTIPADRVPAWGKMNAQQMTEHLSRDAFRVAMPFAWLPVKKLFH
jgi:hypothetical protein